MKWFVLRSLLPLGLLALACQNGQLRTKGNKPEPPTTSRNGGSSGSGDGRGGAGLSPGPLPDAATTETNSTPPSANPTCAEDVKRAIQVPLAVLLVVDGSSSMSSPAGGGNGPSKYKEVEEALGTFVRSPGAAGLTLALQFFPLPGTGVACSSDADCGYQLLAPTPPPCQPTMACAKTVDRDLPPIYCGDGRNIPCPGGDQCVPLGRCLASSDDCIGIGQPCGGRAGDTCVALGKTCAYADEQTCDSAVYEALAVKPVELPLGARGITHALARRGSSGGTPMRPAVEGAIRSFEVHLGDHRDQRGIVVLATDGVPGSCMKNTIPDVAATLAAARTGMRALSSYIIGVGTADVGPDRDALNMLAVAGGTMSPYVITPTERVSQRFLETLNQIRGKALPCEFTIPAPSAGTALDFGKVNMSIKRGAATEEILYAGSEARCDATRGGWYYDVDPTKATPTRVIACPATCAKLKAENDATVELRYGCQTRVID